MKVERDYQQAQSVCGGQVIGSLRDVDYIAPERQQRALERCIERARELNKQAAGIVPILAELKARVLGNSSAEPACDQKEREPDCEFQQLALELDRIGVELRQIAALSHDLCGI